MRWTLPPNAVLKLSYSFFVPQMWSSSRPGHRICHSSLTTPPAGSVLFNDEGPLPQCVRFWAPHVCSDLRMLHWCVGHTPGDTVWVPGIERMMVHTSPRVRRWFRPRCHVSPCFPSALFAPSGTATPCPHSPGSGSTCLTLRGLWLWREGTQSTWACGPPPPSPSLAFHSGPASPRLPMTSPQEHRHHPGKLKAGGSR